MLNPIEINFKLDKTIKRALTTELMIKSHDINVIEFHISFDGLELTADHAVKVLSVFGDSKSQTNVTCNIVDGKAIYRPDTSIISQYENVLNYVYVYLGEQSLDVREFTYSVDLSKIDETALKVKEVYDQSYSDLLENFEQALTDYKDTLPQASDLRAEIDVILDQFSLYGETAISDFRGSGQAEINQFKSDGAREIADFRQQADTDAEVKLTEIQSDANQLFSGAVEQFKQDGDVEIADWRSVADYELEGYLADRVALTNLIVNGDFSNSEISSNFIINPSLQESAAVIDGKLVLKPKTFAWNNNIQIVFPQNIGDKIYCRFTIDSPIATQVDWRVGGVSREIPYGPGESTISFVNTVSSVNNNMYLFTQDFTEDMSIKLDKVKAVSLTKVFGAGNEPTKAELDELIKITGYFDEITLTQKQMLNWQLNLMRQNRNALIALGGTII